MPETNSLTLSIPLDMSLVGVATSFTEQAGSALGLSMEGALKLTLAAEELFSYLARVSGPGHHLEMAASSGGYYVRLKFGFAARDLDLKLFNLTAKPSLQDEADLEDLGLLLASRSVERMVISQEAEHGLGLELIKEKDYPAPLGAPPAAQPLKDGSIGPAREEDLLLTARLLPEHYGPDLFPAGFELPGKLADMVGGGEYWAETARDQAGHVGGAMLWTRQGRKVVRCFGPYLFNQPEPAALAGRLMESFLARLAKSDAVGILAMYPPPDFPAEYFEPLGDLHMAGPDGVLAQRPCFFRQLQEDPGAVAWAHPEIEGFLREQYRELALARELVTDGAPGRERPEHSVFAAEFLRGAGMATLRPLWDGKDAAANLTRHVELLREDGLHNILGQMDLGMAWQADQAPAWLEAGFSPRLVLPYAGQGDLVIFQHAGA